MLARVKQDYAAGPVMAFSGREYVRSEWREVPAGFEEQARHHPLLDTQPSLAAIRTQGAGLPGLGKDAAPAVTVVTAEPPAAPAPVESMQAPQPETPTAEETPAETKPAGEEPASRPSRRRKRATEEE